jgi:hypothetical protein
MLHCPWRVLRPEEDEVEHDEPLEQGFHKKEDCEGIDTDFDVRTILPVSLEELYMSGDFEVYEEWEQMELAFANPSAFTPHLTLEKTCIRSDRWTNQVGTAENQGDIWSHPTNRLFIGHQD